MRSASVKGSYQVRVGLVGALGPVAPGRRLDRHQPGVLPADLVDERLVVRPEGGVAPQHGVERREDGREREAAQPLEVRGRGLVAVPGDADVADEALVLGAGGGLEGAALARDLAQLVEVADGVQLEQVDVVGLQPLQRAVDRRPGALAVAVARLRRQEDVVADPRDPRAQPQLGVAVARGDVEVVDPGVQRLLDRGVGGRPGRPRPAPPRRRSAPSSRCPSRPSLRYSTSSPLVSPSSSLLTTRPISNLRRTEPFGRSAWCA